MISLERFNNFRPLTGIMIFNHIRSKRYCRTRRGDFRPLTGIMIFNPEKGGGAMNAIIWWWFPSPYGDYDF